MVELRLQLCVPCVFIHCFDTKLNISLMDVLNVTVPPECSTLTDSDNHKGPLQCHVLAHVEQVNALTLIKVSEA